MARSVYDGPLDKHMDFTDPIGEGIPASGKAVQKYIKDIDSKKAGIGFTTDDKTKHLVFADSEDMAAYQADPSRTDLVIDEIELRSPYDIVVTFIRPATSYSATFLNSTGNYLSYTFVTTSDGQTIPEGVSVTYTFTHAGTSQVVTENYRSGQTVLFNIDNYLQQGVNDIQITLKGQTTGAIKSEYITIQVVNLILTDNNDISTIYDNSEGNAYVRFNYTVAGNGTKEMEWYLDGFRIPRNADEDEITQINPGQRWKAIDIGSLQQGRHSIQFRVGMEVAGELFYSPVLYREIIVSTGDELGDAVAVIATELPTSVGVLGPQDDVTINGVQYETLLLRLAGWNPNAGGSRTAHILVDGTEVTSVDFIEGEESEVPITLDSYGEKVLSITIGAITRDIDFSVSETTMDIRPITDALEFAFSADGRTNISTNKDQWTDGTHTATFTNFRWTETSGWVDGKLLIPSGASVSFDYAPLGTDPAVLGKTIEFEFESKNVDNDNAVLCNLMNAHGDGIKLTASQVIVTSRSGKTLSRQYKYDENLRVSIVINPHSGPANSGYTFIYFNGILSMGVDVGPSDYYTSDAVLSVGGTDASILLKQIRIYRAALSKEDVLKNYILYRDSIVAKRNLYDKNNLYEAGLSSFDIEKIANYIPVMIITGNIPDIESTNDKNRQITADIQYINMQDPTRSFTCKNAAVRGQGTTSMTYPKKNLRIYTNKLKNAEMRDYQGNIIQNGKYSFKSGTSSTLPAQPVDCWCLKTDFAESSGTHNTGVARLWNEVIKNVLVDGQSVLMTEAQKTARANNYQYDVRTTVDGFPIVVFYRITERDNLVFLGKFNFNNDKSTESVFGFTKFIPEFDNSHVECWECLNSSNAIALFHTVANWNTIVGYDEGKPVYGWMQAFEARYPDKSTNTTALYRLSQWISSTYGADPNGDAAAQAKFTEWQTNKANYFDLYKLASYYVYLMRFGAVDQTVKNAMLTTEDGQHWFFILYDNDTINGVRNDGLLRYGPEIDRQSWDDELGIYCYAGHDSTLWDNFEADDECMALARQIDLAIYTAGLTYANVIDMFNIKQANMWAESIYNQDAQYKYVNNPGYMGSMQGSRSDHRKWWLSTRFALYDSLYMSGTYKGIYINFLIPSAPVNTQFTITAGKDFYYGYGLDDVPQGSPVYLEKDQSVTFATTVPAAIGTSVRIYNPYYIKAIDISNFVPYIGAQNFDVSRAFSASLGTKLKELIIGVDVDTEDPHNPKRNYALSQIAGLGNCTALETLNVAGFKAMTTLDLSALVNLKTFKGRASGLTSITFAAGAPLTRIELPDTFTALTLRNLTLLTSAGIILEDGGTSITSIDIRNCPNLSNSPTLLQSLLNNTLTSVYMDSIAWTNMAPADLISIGQRLKTLGQVDANGYVNVLKGTVAITSTSQQIADDLMALFGPTAFQRGASFFISGPANVFITGPSTVLEGDTAQYNAVVFSPDAGTMTWSLQTGGTHSEAISASPINQNIGILTSTETGSSSSNIVIQAVYRVSGSSPIVVQVPVTVSKRKYPSSSSQVSISGSGAITPEGNTYTIVYSESGITGNMAAQWSLTGSVTDYAEIVSYDNTQCVLRQTQDITSMTEQGTLTLVLRKVKDATEIATKTTTVIIENTLLAISATVNPYAMEVVHGTVPPLAAEADYMTRQEASEVYDIDVQPGSTQYTSIFAKNSNFKNYCTDFSEFKFFTSLTSVPTYLFCDCRFTNIVLPSQITSIGANAFSNSRINSLVVPDSVTSIANDALRDSYLHSIDLGNGVMTIGGYAFSDCTLLTSINIPSCVTSVGPFAFSGCTNLSSVNLTAGLTTLYSGAFYNIGITSLTIPNTVTSIRNRLVNKCQQLASINITSGNTVYYGNGNNCIVEIATKKLIAGCKNTTIPSDTLIIGEYAFSEIPITSVNIPNGVTNIQNYAFSSCSSLTSIVLPNSVTMLGTATFQHCSALASVTLSTSMTAIPASCFYQCSSLASLTIHSGITRIGSAAFASSGLTSITIPNTVTDIEAQAFSMSKIVTAIYSNRCSLVPYSCFRYCQQLTSITLPEGITKIESYAFEGCSALSSIDLPSTITRLDNVIFTDCSSLVSITCRAATPPTFTGTFGTVSALQNIYVPYSSVNAYKAASGWSAYASIIEAIPE